MTYTQAEIVEAIENRIKTLDGTISILNRHRCYHDAMLLEVVRKELVALNGWIQN